MRVCDEHADDRVTCPVGNHEIGSAGDPTLFGTYDRQTGRVTRPDGTVTSLTGEPAQPAAPATTKAEGGEMPRPRKVLADAPATRPWSPTKVRPQREERRFTDEGGSTLTIRLELGREHSTVVWRRRDPKKRKTSGRLYLGVSHPDARAAFAKALEDAVSKHNWQIALTGRPVEMLPIPDAVVRGRKARRAA
jgi:hypothetical protein